MTQSLKQLYLKIQEIFGVNEHINACIYCGENTDCIDIRSRYVCSSCAIYQKNNLVIILIICRTL